MLINFRKICGVILFCILSLLPSLYLMGRDTPQRIRIEPVKIPVSKLPQLIQQLEGGTPQQRRDAAWSLGNVEPAEAAVKAIPAMIRVLKDKTVSIDVRGGVAESLGKIPQTSESARALFEALNDENEDLRWRAANSVHATKEFLLELIEALQNKDPNVRTRIAERLGALGPDAHRAVPALILKLRDDDQFVRSDVAEALGKIGPKAKEAVGALLLTMKNDPYDHTRWKAVEALSKIGSVPKTALPILIKALKDNEPLVRVKAAEVLSSMGVSAKGGVPTLIETVQHDTDPLVRHSAINALGNLGSAAEEAIPGLIHLLKAREVDNYRGSAATALAKIGSKENTDVVAALRWALQDRNSAVRVSAAKALGELGTTDPESISALKMALKDKLPGIRSEAETALKKIGVFMPDMVHIPHTAEPIQTETLVDWIEDLKDKDRSVRDYALTRIESMGPAAKDAVPALIPLLKEKKDWRDFGNVARTLSKIGPAAKEAIPTLVEVIQNHPDESRDEILALATVGVGDPRAILALVQIFKQSTTLGAENAAEALARLGTAAVPSLIEILKEKDERLQFLATYTLAEIGPAAKDAISDLVRILNASTISLRTIPFIPTQGTQNVQSMAAIALGKIGLARPQVVAALTKAIRSDNLEICYGASETLAKFGPTAKDAVPSLLEALSDQRWWVRSHAATSFVRIDPRNPALCTILIQWIADPWEETRRYAAVLLGESGSMSQSVIIALKKALQDKNESVCQSAAQALAKIGSPEVQEIIKSPQQK